MTGKGELISILQRQRAAFAAALPVGAEVRRDRLQRAIDLLVDHQDALCAAMSEDFGHRAKEQSLLGDILVSVKSLKFARDRLEAWMRPERRRADFPLGLLGVRARVEYQPKGVVGVIAPWNFPVGLVFQPLAGALAAGNRVMIKPSERTPNTAGLMQALIHGAFDREEIAVVTGGPEIGEAFAGLPFDHLIFTGSTMVGRRIMQAAVENLTPLTLELGGKSPVIVGRSADLPRAAERIVVGKMINAGQVCLSPDYLLVPDELEQAVVSALAAAARAIYPNPAENRDYASIVNDRHFQRLQGLIEDARAKGAEVIVVAGDGAASERNSPRMPLHIVRHLSGDMQLMQEEIFGPVLPIVTYGDIGEAIDAVNRRARPLALYYFGRDAAEERHVLDRTWSGGVTVNGTLSHYMVEDLPFGGIGPSGMGQYHGHDGFKVFSHARAVNVQPRLNIFGLAGLAPPYGRRTAATLRRELKR